MMRGLVRCLRLSGPQLAISPLNKRQQERHSKFITLYAKKTLLNLPQPAACKTFCTNAERLVKLLA